MKKYKLQDSPRLPIIFFIIGILVINILSLGFISILGLKASIQLAYSSKGEEAEDGSEEEDKEEENGNDDSNDKPSLPPTSNEEEEQEDNTGSNLPPSPTKEEQEPPASFQNPRLVPPAIPLAAGTDDNSMPTSLSMPTPKDQLLPLLISNLCSDAIDCATLRILMNHDYNGTSNTSKDIPLNNIMAVNIQRNNQSISSFTLNANETMTNLLIDPGQYNIIANIVDGSTSISKMSADCSGILKIGETKTCIIVI